MINNPLKYIDPSGHKHLQSAGSVGGSASFAGASSGTLLTAVTTAFSGFYFMAAGIVTAPFKTESKEENDINISEKQQEWIKRADRNLKATDDKHLEAYERDLRGQPIPRKDPGLKPYDHKQDVENAERGLKEAIKKLKNNMEYEERKNNLNEATKKVLQEKINEYQNALDRIKSVRDKLN